MAGGRIVRPGVLEHQPARVLAAVASDRRAVVNQPPRWTFCLNAAIEAGSSITLTSGYRSCLQAINKIEICVDGPDTEGSRCSGAGAVRYLRSGSTREEISSRDEKSRRVGEVDLVNPIRLT